VVWAAAAAQQRPITRQSKAASPCRPNQHVAQPVPGFVRRS
jgi:hypothetical protein